MSQTSSEIEYSEDEIENEIENEIIRSNWCASEKMRHMMRLNQNEGVMSRVDFEKFIKEMLDKKCWNIRNVVEFQRTMRHINGLMEWVNGSSENMITLLSDPKFYNLLNKLGDDLDTINVVCTVEGNCHNIDNEIGDKMIRQARVLGMLIDVYGPIIARFINAFNNLPELINKCDESSISDSGQREIICDVDPNIIIKIGSIRDNFVKAVLERKQKKLKNETSDPTAFYLKKTMQNSDKNIEHYQNSEILLSGSDSLYLLLLFMIIGFFIYTIYLKPSKN